MALPLPHGRLKASEIIRHVLDGVCIPPNNPRSVVLLIRYAGRSNAAFVNASAKAPAAVSAGSAVEQANAGDLRLADLYSKHVVVGWDHVASAYDEATDTETPVAYTPAGGLEVLDFVITKEERPDLFRGLVFVANDPDRFVPKRVDPGAVGKP